MTCAPAASRLARRCLPLVAALIWVPATVPSADEGDDPATAEEPAPAEESTPGEEPTPEEEPTPGAIPDPDRRPPVPTTLAPHHRPGPLPGMWQFADGGGRIAPDEIDPAPELDRERGADAPPAAWADQVRDQFEEVQAEQRPARGKVTVFTIPRPGAQVYVDGIYKGITPTVLGITAGVHTLRVGFSGRPSVEREVDLREMEDGASLEVVIEVEGPEPR